jgi:cell division septal protein FtsQ
VNAIDPRELSDRQLMSHLLFGDLPRRGWAGRRRAIVARILRVAALTVAIIAGFVIVSVAIVLVWAMSLPR